MRGAARVLLSLALLAAPAVYFMAEKRVTLSDDGRDRMVSTFATDVRSVLSRNGLKLARSDIVNPAPGASPSSRIVISRSREVLLVERGVKRNVTVTGRHVEDVLHELGVPTEGTFTLPGLDAELSGGDPLVISRPVQLNVEYDGVTQPVVTNAFTVGALLREMNIVLGPHDIVEPAIVTHPTEGTNVKVVRVASVLETERQPIAFRSVTRHSSDLNQGVRKIETPGREGLRISTFQVTYENGRVKARTLISSTVERQPQHEIVIVGTKQVAPPPPPPASEAFANAQTGKASWYHAPGMTAAHKTLPFGTWVKVTNLANGQSVVVTINDRGPYTGGRIIDLSDDAFEAISTLGTGVINVRIAW